MDISSWKDARPQEPSKVEIAASQLAAAREAGRVPLYVFGWLASDGAWGVSTSQPLCDPKDAIGFIDPEGLAVAGNDDLVLIDPVGRHAWVRDGEHFVEVDLIVHKSELVPVDPVRVKSCRMYS